jgi:hypothetical protein
MFAQIKRRRAMEKHGGVIIALLILSTLVVLSAIDIFLGRR